MLVLEFIVALLTPEAPFVPAYLVADAISADRHAQCVRLVVEDAEKGRAGAQRWSSEGGGAPAQHCLAIADLAAGYPRLAAIRLTEIADRGDAGDAGARARLLAEAALAWLEAGDTAQADGAIAGAIALAPGLADILFVAAKVYAAGNRWQAAADAISAAETKGVKAAEGYVIRARAYRALSRDADAAEDVVAALSLDAFNIDALTLRGDLQQAGITIEAFYGDNAPK